METKSITFNCAFDASGMKSDRNPVYGMFNITEVPVVNTLFIDNKYFPNVDELDLKRYALKPVTGFLKNGDQVFRNAKVTFYSSTSFYYDKIIKEECYTDSAGMYKAYLSPGIYDIEISYNSKVILLRNQKIQNGLTHTFYQKIKASIKKHINDIITFTNSDYLFIKGNLLDENNKPYQGEIVIYDNTYIYVFYRTNEQGKYQFSIKPGTYNILIRSDKTNVQHYVITIDSSRGFSEQLKPQDDMIMSI
jgi:hypothetical protein